MKSRLIATLLILMLLLPNAVLGQGNDQQQMNALWTQADAEMTAGQYDQALVDWQKALVIANRVGNVSYQAGILGEIGKANFNLKEYAKSADAFSRAAVFAHQLGDQSSEAFDLYEAGLAYQFSGQHMPAVTAFSKARALYITLKDQKSEAYSLYYMSLSHLDMNQAQPALDSLNQALALFQTLNDIGGQAQCYSNIGRVYENQGLYIKALDTFNKALPLARQAGDRYTEANIIEGIGGIYSDQGDYNKSLDNNKQALTIYQIINAQTDEARLLINIGRNYLALDNLKAALDYVNQCLTLSRKIGAQPSEAYALATLGGIYGEQGQYTKALDFYNQAMVIQQQIGNQAGQMDATESIADVYQNQGQYAKALEIFNKVLAFRRGSGSRLAEANTLMSIGVLYGQQNRYSEAQDAFNKALAIMRELGNPTGEADAFNNLGLVYDSQGQYGKALDSYNRAIEIAHQLGDRQLESQALGNAANVYDDEGQYARGLELNNQVLAVNRASGRRRDEADTIYNMGWEYVKLRQFDKALDNFNQTLTVRHDIGDQVGEAQALVAIGSVYEDHNKDHAKALDYYNQARAIYGKIKSSEQEGVVLTNIGVVYQDQQQDAKALDFFSQALTLFQKTGELNFENIVLEKRGRSYERLEQTDKAIADYQASADGISTIYGNAVLNSAIIGLAGQKANSIPFEHLPILLAQKGDLPGALHYIESGRAILTRLELGNKPIDFRAGLDQDLLSKETQLSADLNNAQKLVDNLRKDSSATADAIQEAQAALDKARQAYEQHLETMQIKGGFLARQLSLQTATLAQIQKALPADTTMVIYSFGSPDGLIMLVTPTTIDAVTLKDTEQILKLITAFTLDRRANADALSKLYDLLISPIVDKFKTSHLIVVPHDQLGYIPFAALKAPDGSYLIDHYAVSIIPSATALVLLRDRKPAGAATSPGLVLAQPAAPGLPALGHARSEANSVAALLGVKPILNATVTDLRDHATGSQVIQISAHAELNDDAPLFGTIDLKSDGTSEGGLQVRQIYQLDLSKGTELVVLSGCNTASGGDGEDFGVMTRAFFGAGAPRVVASLWSVDDEATAFLIESYIRERTKTTNEADALRAAMLATRQKFPDPYYWASFVLSGLTEATPPDVFATPEATEPSTTQTEPKATQQSTVPVVPTAPPADQRTTIPSGSRRLGVFQVERYCTDKGYGITLTNNQRDWACTNKNGTVALILQPADFDAICAAKYHPGAFAILDQKQKVLAYNWSCYEWVK